MPCRCTQPNGNIPCASVEDSSSEKTKKSQQIALNDSDVALYRREREIPRYLLAIASKFLEYDFHCQPVITHLVWDGRAPQPGLHIRPHAANLEQFLAQVYEDSGSSELAFWWALLIIDNLQDFQSRMSKYSGQAIFFPAFIAAYNGILVRQHTKPALSLRDWVPIGQGLFSEAMIQSYHFSICQATAYGCNFPTHPQQKQRFEIFIQTMELQLTREADMVKQEFDTFRHRLAVGEFDRILFH
ncbi:hypothetical protein FISHEDRAFT_55277 [Fistulina hepatica ATCC 64428]|uniref:Uncharacterized protein n=1 Tax=Fistulina hepatica ATCC 64428 TaxID=1128425 RepID=A0A0D7ANL7_9AGAR|nr:hypothetical protein FISHEDRAFT_55277 [Fistulina hepatica ATCC 64428]